MSAFGFEICLEREPRSIPRRRLTGPLMAACALTIATLAAAVPANASSTGTNSATVNLAPPPVRSITVSPTTTSFGNCTGPNGSGSSVDPTELEFPNGLCTVGSSGPAGTSGITITNGAAAGHIDVNGQSATPADNGQSWSLVVTGTPGTDQFREATNGSQFPAVSSNEVIVPTIPVCDTGFNVVSSSGDCSAAPAQSSTEILVLEGPSASTDQNGPFTVVTTWTAVP
jgi:hypothetical protein